MDRISSKAPRRILIASANPLFSKGLRKIFVAHHSNPVPEMRLVSSMVETLSALQEWQPDLVIVDYDDHTINRAEFLEHFVTSDIPMQVMLVSLQASGGVVVYDRRTLTPAQAEDWLSQAEPPEELPAATRTVRKKTLLTWRWILLSLAVLAITAVFIRLGFWQLDRLAQRRAYNAHLVEIAAQPALDLNTNQQVSALPAEVYRSAVVSGVFDASQEVVLSNQVWGDNELGVHVLTPLRIQGTDYAVLVDRGWLPLDQSGAQARTQFEQPGQVIVKGVLRASQQRGPIFGIQEQVSGGHKDAWSEVNIEAIQKQTGLKLLPVYLQQAPDPSHTGLPYRKLDNLQLGEGPHMGYAIQWFLFAILLAAGYPYFAWKQMRSQGKGRAASRMFQGSESAHHNV